MKASLLRLLLILGELATAAVLASCAPIGSANPLDRAEDSALPVMPATAFAGRPQMSRGFLAPGLPPRPVPPIVNAIH